MGRVVRVPHEHLVIVIFMKINYLIERKSDTTDVRSFWGTIEQLRGEWNILRQFVAFDEPYDMSVRWYPCNNIFDIADIKRLLAEPEISRIDRKLEDFRR